MITRLGRCVSYRERGQQGELLGPTRKWERGEELRIAEGKGGEKTLREISV